MICLLQTCQVTSMVCCKACLGRPYGMLSRSLSRSAHDHLPAANVLEALQDSHCKPWLTSCKHERGP